MSINKNKRVLFFCANLEKGGAERVISLLLKEFVIDESISIYLVMMENSIAYELPQSIKPIILLKTKKSGIRKLLELPYFAWRLSRYINENNIDVVISFLYRVNYINILAKLFGAKYRIIINIRSTTSRYLKEGLLGTINLFLIRKLFNKADLIVSNSQGVDEDLKSIMNITTNTKVIHNPVDLEYINSKKEVCEDIKFSFKEDIKYIISVGRLIPLKRNKDLIDAFNKLQKNDNNIELIFLGDGVLKNDLIKYCKDLNIDSQVYFLGNVKNPFYYLNKSDLFVLNSQTEGFPNVLVEAMAVGLPVISSDCKSGPREILENEKYGYLYPVGNIEKLIEKMKIVLYADIDLASIAKQNLKRIEDFRLDKIMKEFKDILCS